MGYLRILPPLLLHRHLLVFYFLGMVYVSIRLYIPSKVLKALLKEGYGLFQNWYRICRSQRLEYTSHLSFVG
jgi:hypothetical protein